LRIEEGDEYWFAYFNHKKLYFLKEDVVILPISNITIEDLAYWFLQNILLHQEDIKKHGICSIHVKVYNGPGQSGGASWDG
jgi:6-pyruvoyltetrahydropterin/6-carboxytetrahydropterin synthase